MSKSKTVDLTSGPILKTLAELALPIMISSMLGTAYSIMDMAWIGLLGAKAVAGVGVGGMYVWLSQGLASLSRMGGQVNTAQACGRKDYDQARSYAAGSLQLTALSGILFAVSPPEKRAPKLPTFVSYPSGNDMIKSSICASFAAARTSSRVALLPIRIFSKTLSRVRNVF